jgi:hypothetical protein
VAHHFINHEHKSIPAVNLIYAENGRRERRSRHVNAQKHKREDMPQVFNNEALIGRDSTRTWAAGNGEILSLIEVYSLFIKCT